MEFLLGFSTKRGRGEYIMSKEDMMDCFGDFEVQIMFTGKDKQTKKLVNVVVFTLSVSPYSDSSLRHFN